MHLTTPLIQLGVFAASVSAFYPYYPEYKCIADGACLVSSRKGAAGNNVLDDPKYKGKFEIKLKQRIAKSDLPHEERISRYVNRLRNKFSKRKNEFTIIPSAQPAFPNSAGVSQEGSDFSYMGSVQFGSNKQPLELLLDTGAASSWVMSSSCKSDPCTQHDLFMGDSSTSLKTTGKEFKIKYGNGNVQGEWATDDISFAGFDINMYFGLATTVSNDFNNYPMDGLLGLARVPDPEHPGFIQTLVDEKRLAENLFGVNIHRHSDGLNDGSITFGSIDPSKFVGDIKYYPTVTKDSAWGIKIEGGGFHGKKSATENTAIIDTGTSYIFIPKEQATVFFSSLPGAVESANGNSYSVPCDTTTPAQFVFGGVTYEVSAKDWVGGKNGDGSNTCTSNIYPRDATGVGNWLLGDTFLKNVYAVFDMGGQRIGFGSKTAPVMEPSSSSSTSPEESKASPTSTSTSTTSSTSSPTTSSDPTSTTDSSSDSSDTSTGPSSTSTMVTKPLEGGSFTDTTTSEDGTTTIEPGTTDSSETTSDAAQSTESEDPDSAAPQLSACFAVIGASIVAALALAL